MHGETTDMMRQWINRQTGGMVAVSALSVILAAVVAEELYAPATGQEVRNPPSRTAPPQARTDPSTTSYKLPPLQSFSAITDRPLFSQSRRPPAAQPSTTSIGSASSFVLAGVIITHGSREVMIQHGKPPTIAHLQQGQTIEGWTVTAIDEDRVLLDSGETQYELKLIGKSLGPTTAAPAKVAP
jgi:hypothetical protein